METPICFLKCGGTPQIIQVNRQFYRKLIESHCDLGILHFKKPIGHHTPAQIHRICLFNARCGALSTDPLGKPKLLRVCENINSQRGGNGFVNKNDGSYVWVNFSTTSLFSEAWNSWLVRKIIPKWPNYSGW
jgi:hypothetical protein